MHRSKGLFRLCHAAAITAAFLLAGVSAAAQMAPSRTWDELKQETQRRVDKNLGPMSGLKSDDAREALSNIHSLDRDEWAAAWSAVADRYYVRAQREEGADMKDAARDDYFLAFKYYTAARWPVPNSPGKLKAYQNALAAFRNYGKYLDPPVEIFHVPFEGKDIPGYIRLPKGVRPAPIVFMINGTDSRKEDEVGGRESMFRAGIGVVAIDMPGTGESPIKADVGSERMFSRVLDYLATRPDVDSKRIVAWGVSYGGHWSANLAYVERARLRGAVVQGGPVHDYYTADWQRKSLGTPEYLFDLFAARAAIYGVKTLDEFYAVRAPTVPEDAGLSGAALGAYARLERRKRQPGADLRSLHADAIGRHSEVVLGESRRRAHWPLAGMAQFQDRRGSGDALDQGSPGTGVR